MELGPSSLVDNCSAIKPTSRHLQNPILPFYLRCTWILPSHLTPLQTLSPFQVFWASFCVISQILRCVLHIPLIIQKMRKLWQINPFCRGWLVQDLHSQSRRFKLRFAVSNRRYSHNVGMFSPSCQRSKQARWQNPSNGVNTEYRNW